MSWQPMLDPSAYLFRPRAVLINTSDILPIHIPNPWVNLYLCLLIFIPYCRCKYPQKVVGCCQWYILSLSTQHFDKNSNNSSTEILESLGSAGDAAKVSMGLCNVWCLYQLQCRCAARVTVVCYHLFCHFAQDCQQVMPAGSKLHWLDFI